MTKADSVWWIVRSDGTPISGPFSDLRWANLRLQEWQKRIPEARLEKIIMRPGVKPRLPDSYIDPRD